MPDVRKGESEKDYVARCIPYVMKHEGITDTKHAAAKCHGIYKQHKGSEQMKDRVLLHLCADLNVGIDKLAEEKEYRYRIDRSTILIGGGTYNGIYFPTDEITKVEQMWDKKPIVMNHEAMDVGKIVGYIKEPYMLENRMTVDPFLDPVTADYKKALGYVKTRFNAGDVPNVSVGVWTDRVLEEDEEGNERLTARNLEPDHLGLVVRGACNPEDGCGIGMSESENNLEYKTTLFLNNDIEVTWVGNTESDDMKKLKKENIKKRIKMKNRKLK